MFKTENTKKWTSDEQIKLFTQLFIIRLIKKRQKNTVCHIIKNEVVLFCHIGSQERWYDRWFMIFRTRDQGFTDRLIQANQFPVCGFMPDFESPCEVLVLRLLDKHHVSSASMNISNNMVGLRWSTFKKWSKIQKSIFLQWIILHLSVSYFGSEFLASLEHVKPVRFRPKLIKQNEWKIEFEPCTYVGATRFYLSKPDHCNEVVRNCEPVMVKRRDVANIMFRAILEVDEK